MKFKQSNSVHSPAFKAQWRFPKAPKPHASLALSGRISYVEAPELREILFSMIRQDAPPHLVVELGALEQIDTAGIAVLVEGLATAQASDKKLLLCGPSDRVRATFEMAGLKEALHSCCKGPREVGARLTTAA
ncbi:MAG: STAS domain-containing protein [Pseudomonadota bacterium]|nr:STAS domain-containing protein [Pseudomonadota bacterium]